MIGALALLAGLMTDQRLRRLSGGYNGDRYLYTTVNCHSYSVKRKVVVDNGYGRRPAMPSLEEANHSYVIVPCGATSPA